MVGCWIGAAILAIGGGMTGALDGVGLRESMLMSLSESLSEWFARGGGIRAGILGKTVLSLSESR